MKYCRFLLDGHTRYGVVEDRNGELWITGPSPAPAEDLAYRIALDEATPGGFDFAAMPLDSATLLPPVTPSKIICVGRNYREHVRELGNEMPAEPLLFFKPPSSLLAPGGAVRLPAVSERVDFEGELALVIGRRVRQIKPGAQWRDVVRGFTLANDISARDLQKEARSGPAPRGSTHFAPSARWSAMNSTSTPASPSRLVSTANSASTRPRSISSFPFQTFSASSLPRLRLSPATSSSPGLPPASLRFPRATGLKSPLPALAC